MNSIVDTLGETGGLGTATLEKKLSKIANSKLRHDNLTNKKCPTCGKNMLSVNGKNSKMLVCQDRECGYRETIARTSNARCPVCHKKMEVVGQGDSQTFPCACGHKEKLTAFQDRRLLQMFLRRLSWINRLSIR